MQPFPGPANIWPHGPDLWHLYALPDPSQPELTRLIDATRAVALDAGAAALAVVEPRFLHTTIQKLTLPPNSVTSTDLEALAADLRARLSSLQSFTLHARWPQAGAGGVELDLFDPHPHAPWNTLAATIRAGIEARFGPAAIEAESPLPHLTVAYCAQPMDSGTVQARLRRQVRLPDAPFPVTAVHLLRVRQDPDKHTYEWTESQSMRIPLGLTLDHGGGAQHIIEV